MFGTHNEDEGILWRLLLRRPKKLVEFVFSFVVVVVVVVPILGYNVQAWVCRRIV